MPQIATRRSFDLRMNGHRRSLWRKGIPQARAAVETNTAIGNRRLTGTGVITPLRKVEADVGITGRQDRVDHRR
jgi:hypothetical protein